MKKFLVLFFLVLMLAPAVTSAMPSCVGKEEIRAAAAAKQACPPVSSVVGAEGKASGTVRMAGACSPVSLHTAHALIIDRPSLSPFQSFIYSLLGDFLPFKLDPGLPKSIQPQEPNGPTLVETGRTVREPAKDFRI